MPYTASQIDAMVYSASETAANIVADTNIEFTRTSALITPTTGQTSIYETAYVKIAMTNISINDIASFFSAAVSLIESYITQLSTSSGVSNSTTPTVNTSFTRTPTLPPSSNTSSNSHYFTINLTIELSNVESALLNQTFQMAVSAINAEINQTLALV